MPNLKADSGNGILIFDNKEQFDLFMLYMEKTEITRMRGMDKAKSLKEFYCIATDPDKFEVTLRSAFGTVSLISKFMETTGIVKMDYFRHMIALYDGKPPNKVPLARQGTAFIGDEALHKMQSYKQNHPTPVATWPDDWNKLLDGTTLLKPTLEVQDPTFVSDDTLNKTQSYKQTDTTSDATLSEVADKLSEGNKLLEPKSKPIAMPPSHHFFYKKRDLPQQPITEDRLDRFESWLKENHPDIYAILKPLIDIFNETSSTKQIKPN